MRLSRKILLPTLLWFALLVVILVAGLGVGIAQQNRARERDELARIEDAYHAEVQWLTNSALGIALSVTNNPDIQAALIRQDKEQLLALVRPSYEQTLAALPISGLTFFTPDGDFLLSALQQTPGETRVQETPSGIAREALSTHREASGLLLTANGLGLHVAVPVSQGDTFAGVAEITLQLGTRVLQDIKKNFGSDLQILLTQEAVANTGTRFAVVKGPFPALVGYISTLSTPVFGNEKTYQAVLEGTPQTSYVQSLQTRHIIRSTPLKDANGNTIGVIDFVADRSQASRFQNQRIAFSLGGIILAMLVGSVGMTYFTNRALAPLRELSLAAEDIIRGDTTRRVEVIADDELGLLARALNAFSQHIQSLNLTLEQRVTERTQELERRTLYLQSAAEIARASTTLTDLDALLNRSAALINERFQLYHTAIFLRDSAGEQAILRAAAGHNQEAVLSQNISLRIGTEGAIGHVIATGEAHIVTDTATDPYYIPDPLLPDTRSEIIVPLRVSNRILGALDIESATAADALVDEMQILQILADQIAIAIENALLLEENRASLSASRRLYGELSRADWSRLLSNRLLGYESSPTGAHPLPDAPASETPATDSAIEIPLEAYGKVIGSIYAEKRSQESWSPEERLLLQEVTQQISLALESARLLNQLQERSRRETIINQIADAMGQTLDVDLLLQNILREMGENMGFEMLEIRLGTPDNSAGGPPETASLSAEG